MGHRLVPVDFLCGLRACRKYPCLTSAVMAMAPAKVAGVKRIVALSSRGREKRINPAILYTMAALGASEIYCLGAPRPLRPWLTHKDHQARGPDRRPGTPLSWKQSARLRNGGHRFLAGPSECMVIADETGRRTTLR